MFEAKHDRPSRGPAHHGPAEPARPFDREEAELAIQTLQAIRHGEVDAFVVADDPTSPAVYTLKSADRPYRLLVEQMLEGAAIVASDGLILYANAGLATLLGRPLGELAGSRITDYLDPAELGRLAALIADPGLARADVVMRRADGRRIDVYISVGTLNKDPLQACLIFTDFSEHRRMIKALQESEERFRLLAEHSKDAIFLVTLQAPPVLAYISPAAEQVLGRSTQELIGDLQHALDRLGFDDREDAEAIFQATDSRPRVLRYHRPDGSAVWLERSANGIRSEAGELVAVEGTLRDVTDRVAAEKQRLEAVRQLEQTERLESLGQLAGGIAHDFNNLLSVILGTAQLQAEDLDPSDPQMADVQRIIHAAERGADLTKQLLIFSRREPAESEILDLNATLTQIKDMLHRTMGEDIRFIYRLSPAPPIHIDRARIEQVVMNLVVNARAAMPHGGNLFIETADVTIPESGADAVPAGRYTVLTVADSGEGMSPEIAQHVFEPFFTTREPGQGTGLGLATVHGIVAQAAGHITVDTRPGEGTTIRVYLPATSGHAVSATPSTGPSAHQGHGETILLVEDEQPVREVVERILTRNHYHVLTPDDPQKAVKLCADPDVRIDAMLTNMIMPGMSGRQLAEQLHNSTRAGLPVLYITGYAGHDRAGHRALQRDMNILRKPFDTDTLLSRVRDTLDRW